MIAALNWAFQQKDLPSTCKFVLVAMADYSSEDRNCWPSIEAIESKTNLNRKTIIRCLKHLESVNLLEDTGMRMGSTKSIKVYQIKCPEQKSSPKNGTAISPKQSQFRTEAVPILPGSSDFQFPKQELMISIADTSSTQPSVEPSKEPLITKKYPPLQEVKLACAKFGIVESDAEWFWYKCEGNGWTNGGKAIKSWIKTIIAWKLAGYLPSQKQSNLNNTWKNSNNTGTGNQPFQNLSEQEILKLAQG